MVAEEKREFDRRKKTLIMPFSDTPSNNNPKKPGKWRYLVGVFTIIGALATLVALIFNKNGIEQNIKGNNNVQIVGDNSTVEGFIDEQNDDEFINVMLAELKKNWDRFPNDIQAKSNFKKFYAGKKVRWECNVNNLNEVDRPILSTSTSLEIIDNTDIDVYCDSGILGDSFIAIFPANEDNKNKLTVLKKDDKITITGTLDANFDGSYAFLHGESFEYMSYQ